MRVIPACCARAYVERRTKEDLSKKEIIRRLNCMIAGELYFIVPPVTPSKTSPSPLDVPLEHPPRNGRFYGSSQHS